MKETIKNLLRNRPKKRIEKGQYKSAAVLVPLFEKEGQTHVLLTQRTGRVKDHKNEISLPGGIRNKSDGDLKATAIRETHEELGISESNIEIAGELDDEITITGYVISPILAWIPYPYGFKINRQEVASLVEIPLSYFKDPKNASMKKFMYAEMELVVPFYKYQKYEIWGATARIIQNLIKIIG